MTTVYYLKYFLVHRNVTISSGCDFIAVTALFVQIEAFEEKLISLGILRTRFLCFRF